MLYYPTHSPRSIWPTSSKGKSTKTINQLDFIQGRAAKTRKKMGYSFSYDASGDPRSECESPYELLGHFLESDVQGSIPRCKEILHIIDEIFAGKTKTFIWKALNEQHKDMACRNLLLKLQKLGFITFSSADAHFFGKQPACTTTGCPYQQCSRWTMQNKTQIYLPLL